MRRISKGPLRVVEIGFGRGFQSGTLLRRLAAEGSPVSVEIHAFEPHPEILEPWPEVPPGLSDWMPWWGKDYRHQNHWQGEFEGTRGWSLDLHPVEAQEAEPWTEFGPVDLYLVDLFSPGKHPQQWRAPLFERMAAHAGSSCLLTTYTCARQVRDRLQECGWEPVVLKREGWRDTLVAHFRPTAT